jgi:hypothetical protein
VSPADRRLYTAHRQENDRRQDASDQQTADEPWWSDAEAVQQMHAEGRSNWSYSDWDRFNLARAAAKENRRISQQKAALEADELRRSNALEAQRRRNIGAALPTPKAPSDAVRRLDSDEPIENMSLQNLREELRDSRAVGDDGSLPSLERSKTSQSREPKPVPTENPDLSEDLEQLSQLFERGLLTEDEFTAAKKRLLEP